jgi:hypothetical protein
MMDDANRAMAPLRPTVSTDRKNQAEGSLPSPSEAPQTAHALASALEGQAFSGRN